MKPGTRTDRLDSLPCFNGRMVSSREAARWTLELNNTFSALDPEPPLMDVIPTHNCQLRRTEILEEETDIAWIELYSKSMEAWSWSANTVSQDTTALSHRGIAQAYVNISGEEETTAKRIPKMAAQDHVSSDERDTWGAGSWAAEGVARSPVFRSSRLATRMREICCEQCGADFARRYDLDRHLLSHERVTPDHVSLPDAEVDKRQKYTALSYNWGSEHSRSTSPEVLRLKNNTIAMSDWGPGWAMLWPDAFDNFQLDIVGLLAILGEGSLAANAQVSALSNLSFLPRLMPTPQSLMWPNRKLAGEPTHRMRAPSSAEWFDRHWPSTMRPDLVPCEITPMSICDYSSVTVDWRDSRGTDPRRLLASAVTHANYDMSVLLLEHGSDKARCGSESSNALACAAAIGRSESARLLLCGTVANNQIAPKPPARPSREATFGLTSRIDKSAVAEMVNREQELADVDQYEPMPRTGRPFHAVSESPGVAIESESTPSCIVMPCANGDMGYYCMATECFVNTPPFTSLEEFRKHDLVHSHGTMTQSHNGLPQVCESSAMPARLDVSAGATIPTTPKPSSSHMGPASLATSPLNAPRRAGWNVGYAVLGRWRRWSKHGTLFKRICLGTTLLSLFHPVTAEAAIPQIPLPGYDSLHLLDQTWLLEDDPSTGVQFLGLLAALLLELFAVFSFRPDDEYKGKALAGSIPVSIIVGVMYTTSVRQAILIGWMLMNATLFMSAVYHGARALTGTHVTPRSSELIEKVPL
ncbi:hypothetical protein LTR15_005902 [Elasticomyces elasticus]|nr:hypothetical protein LTR15_005902 [Elasticomyces elasticus]